MKIDVSYAEVKSRYPVLADEMMDNLRSGKSMNKDAKPEELEWSFDWSQRITGACDFGEMLASLGKPKPPRPTVQEKMAEVIPNLFVCLAARIGRWSGRTRQIPVPEEVLDFYRENFEKDEAEHKRFNALPKREQDTETAGLISQVSRSPGVTVFNMRKKP